MKQTENSRNIRKTAETSGKTKSWFDCFLCCFFAWRPGKAPPVPLTQGPSATLQLGLGERKTNKHEHFGGMVSGKPDRSLDKLRWSRSLDKLRSSPGQACRLIARKIRHFVPFFSGRGSSLGQLSREGRQENVVFLVCDSSIWRFRRLFYPCVHSIWSICVHSPQMLLSLRKNGQEESS